MKSACRRVARGAILSLVLMAVSTIAAASLEENVSSPHYFVRAPSRLLQGIINFSFGWTSFVLEPVKSVRNHEDRFVDGMFRGLAYPFSYTFLGAWDIGTFWVPGPDKLPTDIAKVHKNVFSL